MKTIYEDNDIIDRSIIESMIRNSTEPWDKECAQTLLLERLSTAHKIEGLFHPTLSFAHWIRFDSDKERYDLPVCNDGYGCEFLRLSICLTET